MKVARRSKQTDTYDLTLKGHKPIQPRTETQRTYLEAIRRSDMTIGIGPAGTGKTFVASAWAAEQLAEKKVQQVILTRPIVTIENENIGFLPGTLEKKMEPWTAPIFDTFIERVGVEETHAFLKGLKLRIVPFGFMRGRTFKDAIVLVDEAQNISGDQARALVTRIGENTRYVINGDLTQSDRNATGLKMLINIIREDDLPFPIVEFSEKDCVRSKACRLWLDAFAKRQFH